MSESLEPGAHATFTHSPWRGLDDSRAGAALLLGGSPSVPAVPRALAVGAARSAADMCAECSSIDAEWRQAARSSATPANAGAAVATARGMDTVPPFDGSVGKSGWTILTSRAGGPETDAPGGDGARALAPVVERR